MVNLTHQRRMASLQSALAPLQDLLERESIVEIMLNADGRIWIDVELNPGFESCSGGDSTD